jgi:hypothetical protein
LTKLYAPKEAVKIALEIARRIVSRHGIRKCDAAKAGLRVLYLAHGGLGRAFPRAPKATIARAVGFPEADVYEAHRRYNSTKWNAHAVAGGKRGHGGRWWSLADEDEIFSAVSKFEPAALPWAPDVGQIVAPPKPEFRVVEANARPPYELLSRRIFTPARNGARRVVEIGSLPPPGRSALDQMRNPQHWEQ